MKCEMLYPTYRANVQSPGIESFEQTFFSVDTSANGQRGSDRDPLVPSDLYYCRETYLFDYRAATHLWTKFKRVLLLAALLLE